MSQWAKYQPKDGDLILVCGHRHASKYHWYSLEDIDDNGNPMPIQFKRPDGSEGEASWMCICDRCNTVYAEKPSLAIRGERTWMGDDPFITAPS